MDWSDSPEQAAFRAEVRALLDEQLPERYRTPGGNWAQDRRSPDSGGAPGGAGLDRRARRAQLVRAALAGGVRRRRPLDLGADDPPRGDGNGARACRGRAGRGAVRPDDHPRRHRGAEARAPATDGERRTPDALRALRARRRLRPRLAADARSARRRRVRGERSEDLDLERPPRRLPLGAGTDGPRRAQAPRDQRAADPHRPRRGGAATAHQHGLGARLQRDLL